MRLGFPIRQSPTGASPRRRLELSGCSFNRSATRRADLESWGPFHPFLQQYTKLVCLPLATLPLPDSQISNSIYCGATFSISPLPTGPLAASPLSRAPNQPTNQPKDTTTSLSLSSDPRSVISIYCSARFSTPRWLSLFSNQTEVVQ